ncbi:tetratricopeptide repeat protein, partial [Aduncisulcus paluster]
MKSTSEFEVGSERETGVFIPALKDSSTPHVAGEAGSASGFAQQIEETKNLLESQPDSVNLWTKLGNLYFDTDQYANAIDAYNKSLALEPDNAHVLTDL